MAYRRKRVPAIDNEARISKSADMVMSEWLSGWRIIPTGFCPSSYGGAIFLAVSRLENHQGDENTQNPLSDVIIYLRQGEHTGEPTSRRSTYGRSEHLSP